VPGVERCPLVVVSDACCVSVSIDRATVGRYGSAKLARLAVVVFPVWCVDLKVKTPQICGVLDCLFFGTI